MQAIFTSSLSAKPSAVVVLVAFFFVFLFGIIIIVFSLLVCLGGNKQALGVRPSSRIFREQLCK